MTNLAVPDRADQYDSEHLRRAEESLRLATLMRRAKYDLCGRCDERRTSRTHQPGYRMERTPYVIPGHAFEKVVLS